MTSEVMWPLLCVALGLALILVEAFVPSGGLIGLLALGLIGYGVILAFQKSTTLGFGFLLGVAVALPSVTFLALSLWPYTPIARRAALRPPEPDDLRDDSDPRLDHLLGQFGRALTPLRPSGLVGFEGRRLDGQAEEGMIAPGTLVEAIRVRGHRLIVRVAREAQFEPFDGDSDGPESGGPLLLG